MAKKRVLVDAKKRLEILRQQVLYGKELKDATVELIDIFLLLLKEA